jgi:ABC-type Fe3+/spermidine/putrescine transport system ATPase subunit
MTPEPATTESLTNDTTNAVIANLGVPNSEGLSLRNLRKSYGNNVVLHDLSLEVGRGQLLSLLGPSGCGKTTTLNLIAGFADMTSGEIRLGGKNITAVPPNRRDTAIVFQNYALFPHMTVAENVGYGLKARKLRGQAVAERVGKMLELLDIGALGKRYPGELSGGQQQRVSLARAIAVQPSLLLLDEPLSNLDTKLRQEIRLEIRKLQQELEQTAVFVTHDQEEALVISDYIAVLNKGWLEQHGTPQELWEHPRTAYVADFMGVENILEVSTTDGQVRVAEAGRNLGAVVPLPVSDQAHVGFRPSNARIAAVDAEADSSALVMEVTVLDSAYMGTSFRYTVDASGGSARTIHVEQPVGDWQAKPGDSVRIIIDAPGLLPLGASAATDTAAIRTA